MKYIRLSSVVLSYFLVLSLFFRCNKKNESFISERNLDFNPGWKFIKDDIQGGDNPNYNDSEWRLVDLPHDWSVEDYPIKDMDHSGPFNKNLPMGQDVGYLAGGTGWYRKELVIEQKNAGREVILNFDGVQSEMTLWVNGHKAGHHVYGYTPFYYNITQFLNAPGEKNVLAVRVFKPEQNSRWFTGAGIYRPITISFLDPVHVDVWGVEVQTETVNSNGAALELGVRVGNNCKSLTDVTVETDIISPKGHVVATAVAQGSIPVDKKRSFSLVINLENPTLWDLNTPALYVAKVHVLRNGNVVDEFFQPFGIRTIHFSTDKGFLLNGNPVLLKGSCIHHDNGLLGAMAFKNAEIRRVRIMKDNGYNAIRTSHNPPSRYFLDACDELGMLVIDESFDAWFKPKRPNDYHLYFKDWWKRDLETMLQRDRNHPSVIMWSFGNEIQERADSSGLAIARQMIDFIKSLDDSRPVTQAICRFWDNPGKTWEDTAPAFGLLDVSGYNYQWMKYESDHEKNPDRIMFGSESVPNEAFENWQKVKQLPYVIGDFVWTGMDYIGESGIGHSICHKKSGEKDLMLMPWPWYVSWCGDIDLVGNKKPQSYYRDILWENSKLEVLVDEPLPNGMIEKTSYWGWPNRMPSWNWQGHEGESLLVNVYSSYPMVRMELNGRLIGKKRVSENTRYTAIFRVPYEAGTLKVIGVVDGNDCEEIILKTTGPVVKLKLVLEHKGIFAERSDVAYIKVEGYDKADNAVPDSDLKMKVKIEGAADLLAAGNASPTMDGSMQDNDFRLYNGKALIIVRSSGHSGPVYVTVESDDGIIAETDL